MDSLVASTGESSEAPRVEGSFRESRDWHSACFLLLRSADEDMASNQMPARWPPTLRTMNGTTAPRNHTTLATGGLAVLPPRGERAASHDPPARPLLHRGVLVDARASCSSRAGRDQSPRRPRERWSSRCLIPVGLFHARRLGSETQNTVNAGGLHNVFRPECRL